MIDRTKVITKTILYFLLSSIFIWGCEACDEGDPVRIPAPIIYNPTDGSDSIDVNYDNIQDYALTQEIHQTTDEPSSASTIILQFSPLNNSHFGCVDSICSLPVILKSSIVGDGSLFWSNQPQLVMYKNWSISNGWDEYWSSNCCEQDKNYIALRLDINGSFYFGWLQFQVDIMTGEIEILGYKVTDQPDQEIEVGSYF